MPNFSATHPFRKGLGLAPFRKGLGLAPFRFADLFCGLGGIRLGLEQAAEEAGYAPICVFSSEIKPSAVKVYRTNFPEAAQILPNNITEANAETIPDIDFLLAGFPCQPFSCAGARRGFSDTRGTLFFEVERILKAKKPKGFLLENVEGLVNHDKGNTLKVILNALKKLGYRVSYEVIDASLYGVPQARKRIYIVGSLKHKIPLKWLGRQRKTIKDILVNEEELEEYSLPYSSMAEKLLEYCSPEQLKRGVKIRDKRAGIHSWELGLKGTVSAKQKEIMNVIMAHNRKKGEAVKKGMKIAEGIPFSIPEIRKFGKFKGKLYPLIEELVFLRYLKEVKVNGKLNYAILGGKLSYEISDVFPDTAVAPTLTSSDCDRLAVYQPEYNRIRRFTAREGLRLFGFPENYIFGSINDKYCWELLGNSVCVPVIYRIMKRWFNHFK